jgi:hypothetical protein
MVNKKVMMPTLMPMRAAVDLFVRKDMKIPCNWIYPALAAAQQPGNCASIWEVAQMSSDRRRVKTRESG